LTRVTVWIMEATLRLVSDSNRRTIEFARKSYRLTSLFLIHAAKLGEYVPVFVASHLISLHIHSSLEVDPATRVGLLQFDRGVCR
jgi:hypothetical protein